MQKEQLNQFLNPAFPARQYHKIFFFTRKKGSFSNYKITYMVYLVRTSKTVTKMFAQRSPSFHPFRKKKNNAE